MSSAMDEIVAKVQEYYDGNSAPLWLSALGNMVKLEDGERVSDVIRADEERRVRLVAARNKNGALVAALPENEEEIASIVSKLPGRKGPAACPRSLLSAFLHPAEEISYNLARKRYRLGPSPGLDWRPIPIGLRPADLRGRSVDSLSDEELAEVATSARAWLAEAAGQSTAGGCALQRLIGAQPEHVRRQILIPGDIAALLASIP